MTQRSEALDFFGITSDGGVRMFVRVSPSAAKNEIAGLWNGANGETRLVIKVTAPPDKGKANARVIKLIATHLGLPKSSLSIMAGETSRLKTLRISADRQAIIAGIKSLSGEIK
ncbi:MAG: DUF167 domain-containing protein [Pseudomonadota bacterium]